MSKKKPSDLKKKDKVFSSILDLGPEEDEGLEGIMPCSLKITPAIVSLKNELLVGGNRQTITLKTDKVFLGKGSGTLSCTWDSEAVCFYCNKKKITLTDNQITFDDFDQSGVTLEVEALHASKYKGIELKWTLNKVVDKYVKNVIIGDAAIKKLTVVKATLNIYNKLGSLLSDDEKKGDGRVIHLQNKGNDFSRAKVEVNCEPLECMDKLTLEAEKGNIQLFDDKTGGSKKGLPLTLVTGAEKASATFYVQGSAVSSSKADTGLNLFLIGEPKEQADIVKITVVEAKLILYERYIDDKTEPLPVDDDKKDDPGRAIYLQGVQRASTRAKMRVLKTPTDAPCDVVLKAAADHVKLWDRRIPDKKVEKQVTTPKTLASTDFPDAAKGFVAWAEGAKITTVGARSAFTLEVKDVEDVSDTAAFTVRQAKVEIEIVRSDKAALSKAVKVGIKEKATDSASSLKDYTNAKIEYEVAPGSYLFELTPQDQEAAFNIMRMVPDGSLEAALVVKESAVTPVKFSLEPAPNYDYFQFISYEIETGKYMGLDTADTEEKAEDDIKGRCEIMKEAIEVAHPKADASADTMKVFVAPEFYFRGIQGAYPVTTLHMITDKLREHTKDPKFKNWLFVYGSAIGLLKHSDNEVLPDVKSVTVVAPPPNSAYIVCEKTPKAGQEINKWKKGSLEVVFPAFTVTRSVGTVHEVKFSTPPPAVASGWSLYLNDGSDEYSITMSSFKEIKCLRGTFTGTAIPDTTLLKQGASTGFVVAAKGLATPQTWEIFTDCPTAVAGTDLKLTKLGQTEIFNVVFIQKGGSGTPMKKDGSCELKDLLIYKEWISSVDYEGDDYNEQDFYKKHRHVTKLSGKYNRTLPTQGSTDVLGDKPNVMGQPRKGTDGSDTTVTTSETTTTGLGGGAIFMVDGVDFGVDVCLDHAQKRLKNSGKTVHIHLIPSCGMSIINSNTAIVSKGFVFNVDGQKNNPHTRLQRDSIKVSAPLPATPFAGTARATFFPKDGKIYVYPREQKQW